MSAYQAKGLDLNEVQNWGKDWRVATHTGKLDGKELKIAIVAALFNHQYTKKLMEGALQGLRDHGVKSDHIETFWVPGAFELPVTALKVAKSEKFHAVITLGVIIKGDTAHFDYVAGPCADGVMQASLKAKLPIIFGVLTAHTVEQVEDRTGGRLGNKGYEYALAAVRMGTLFS